MQIMVVDMLEGFSRLGPLASPRVDALVSEQAVFLGAVPSGSHVVFLADAHRPDDDEFKRFPPHCLRDTPEAEIRRELLSAVEKSDATIEIVRKRSFSGFLGTDLESRIQARVDKSWIVIGCVTDCCIEAAVADLAQRGYGVTVVRNLIDTWDMTAEQAADAGLSPAHAHPAEQINAYYFDRRFPGIWGAHVVADWKALVEPGDTREAT